MTKVMAPERPNRSATINADREGSEIDLWGFAQALSDGRGTFAGRARNPGSDFLEPGRPLRGGPSPSQHQNRRGTREGPELAAHKPGRVPPTRRLRIGGARSGGAVDACS